MRKIVPNNSFIQFLLYSTPNGKIKLEIFLKDENIWLTQAKIAELFMVDRSVITKHLQNIYLEDELTKESTSAKIAQVQNEGTRQVTRDVEFYNLDAILSVGYRVNSKQATQFRIWATERLKEYIIKGFTMDDERLKDPNSIFGKDYFEEQLARIRSIRSSERRFYQKITDIYAQCSADYNPNEEITKLFFATVQNKLHFAISGQTAAEIIYSRVGNSKPYMGLTNWVEKLDAFLHFNEREILQDNGNISHEVAVSLAEEEFDKFQIEQDKNYISDFDREVKKLLKKS